ncbi:hypothetical protein CDAR_22671 [Caerostris darwini]|uniref:Uncharacterized protein n=1 Tax=Caerostris darwini TaxID=1538125 RepID=A0AAV4S0P5_9ARAC|nr:hypothetical protein CDAR_22671 [Caerostris darwini]
MTIFHQMLFTWFDSEQSRGLGGKVALQGQVADEPEPGRWTRVVGRPQSFLIHRLGLFMVGKETESRNERLARFFMNEFYRIDMLLFSSHVLGVCF